MVASQLMWFSFILFAISGCGDNSSASGSSIQYRGVVSVTVTSLRALGRGSFGQTMIDGSSHVVFTRQRLSGRHAFAKDIGPIQSTLEGETRELA